MDANQLVMDQMLSKLGGDNPKLQMIMEMMKQQNQPETESAIDSEKSRMVARKRKKMRHAIQLMQQRNMELAQALGACVCWGEIKQCTVCSGRGKPGWQDPEEDLFLHYVGPAMQYFADLDEHDEISTSNVEKEVMRYDD